jgi:predicted Zn-dependent protease
MADDELQEVRDNFYAGNYQKALLMAEGTAASSDFGQSELGAILARCCLASNSVDRLKTMQNSEIPGQRAAVFTMIMTKSRQEAQRASAKERLLSLAKETQDMSCNMLSAIAHALDGNWKEAAELCKAHPTLEMQALCVMFCLSCNQVGMAEKILKDMQGSNDDSAAFRLANAAVKMALGDPEEAYLTYCDLSSQFPPKDGEDSETGSVLLQVGKALANMQRGMFGEAMEDLQRAAAVSPNDPDVLVNMCCCLTHLGKKDEFQQCYAKLEAAAPSHPYVVKTQGMKNVFAKFKASAEI